MFGFRCKSVSAMIQLCVDIVLLDDQPHCSVDIQSYILHVFMDSEFMVACVSTHSPVVQACRL